jgi:hypothetical protein
MKTKNPDCVQMQHRGAKAIQEKLAGRTRDERLEYWRQRTEDLRGRQEALQRQRGTVNRAR